MNLGFGAALSRINPIVGFVTTLEPQGLVPEVPRCADSKNRRREMDSEREMERKGRKERREERAACDADVYLREDALAGSCHCHDEQVAPFGLR